MNIKRSFCMTSYNSINRIYVCLKNICDNMKDDEELVIVDNYSSDGTWDVIKHNTFLYPDKRIVVMQKHCNRGVGWQTAVNLSIGNHVILVASDCYYNDYFWEMLSCWENHFLYDFRVLYANETWDYPRCILDDIGGFPNTNGSEDAYHWGLLFDRNQILWCPVCVGENYKPVDDPEWRYTKSFFRMLWRVFICHKDAFRYDRALSFKIKLDEAKSWTKNRFRFFCFWLPLISVTSVYHWGKGKPIPRFVPQDIIIDFGLKGKIHPNIFDWTVI